MTDLNDVGKTRRDATGQSVDWPEGHMPNDQGDGARDLAKGARTAKIPGFDPVEVIESPGMIRKKELASEDLFY